MSLEIQTDPVPLQAGESGVILVRGSRVMLDTIVEAFRDGASAEEIAQQYPSLQLADVYAVLGYYLRHSAAVDAYLAERRAQTESLRREHQDRWNDAGARARLLARRNRSA